MKPILRATEHIYTVEIPKDEGIYEVVVFIRMTGRKRKIYSELRSGPQSFWASIFNSRVLPDNVRKEAESIALKEWKSSKI